MKINRDETRVATFWLKDDLYWEVSEVHWPDSLLDLPDTEAAETWSDLLGVNVTIKTEILTTVDLR